MIPKSLWWTAYFKCISDSHDWGKAGATKRIGNIKADTEQQAIKIAETLRPGNWKTIKVKQQAKQH